MSIAQPSNPIAITQIVYLSIPTDKDLKDAQSYSGKLWSSALDLIESSEGFRRLYWGRCLEQPERVQLHVVRTTHQHHNLFATSPAQTQFTALLHALGSSGSRSPVKAIRYVALRDFTPNSKALGKGAPFTGSAIYLSPTAAWHEGAWPLWTHIVRYVDGCMGCSGGEILGSVELLEAPTLVGEVNIQESKREGWEGARWEGYLVYVGWESVVSQVSYLVPLERATINLNDLSERVTAAGLYADANSLLVQEKHEAYHHTKHFGQHRVILGCGNAGFAEYGHVVFEGNREKASTARL